MQNPDGAAALAAQQHQRETTESLALLREAVLRLTQHAVRAAPTAAPTSRLTKLGPEDDVEAYLEVFERTAQREGWPEEQWAHIVAPFLTGPAQQASQDLPADVARQYPALKQAILAYYGHNLAARAQRAQDWRFDAQGAVRTQIAQHSRLVKRWLTAGEGPSPIDRVIIDHTLRRLPPDARRVLAHHHPATVDDLVLQLENWQVAQLLNAGSAPAPRRAVTGQAPRGPPSGNPAPGVTPLSGVPENREVRRCFGCGQYGHIARYCPRGRDVSMPSAYADPGADHTCMLATCWTQGTSGSPTIPARVMNQDTQALLDTGSAVTLLRPDLAGGKAGDPMEVACVHGDIRTYPTCHVVVRTTHGVFTIRAGIVPHLPVPVLIGRDCPIFHRLWDPTRELRSWRGPPRRGARGVRQAYGATRRPSSPGELTAEDEGSEGNGPSPPGTPARTARGPVRSETPEPTPDTPETLTASEQPDPPEDPESSPLTEFSDFLPEGGEGSSRPGQFATAQLQDEALKHAWSHVLVHDGQARDSVSHTPHPHFSTRGGLLYRVASGEGGVREQLVVPRSYVSKVLFMAHTHLLGAHLGMDKTRERVLARFYWPGVKRDVERHCQGCPECQRVAPRAIARHPLIPMPIIETPFERLALDIVGPLPKTSRGHRYILVLVDYATRYPEALPLRAATTKAVARELMLLFSRVGIAKEVLTDQGSCFMSRVMKEVLRLLQVKQLRTSVYHPQTDGLVERFNKTLKQMLKKTMQADGKNWDQLLPHVLFAVREVPQASTGFSPFELLYGRRPRGILDIAKEAWESQPSPHRTTVDHVEQVRDRMARVWPIVRRHLQQAQQAQARVYNRGAQLRTFQPGELVLVLVPTAECRFLAKWQGPYEVVERVGEVNYRVRQPGRRKPTQLYHINLLKQWRGGEPTPADPAPLSLAARQEIPEVPVGEDLSPAQRHDLDEIVLQHRDVFSDLPGRTAATHHDIRTAPGIRVRVPPYRIPEARREAIRAEVRRMLQLGVIEESRSAWCSPVVLVPKPDGTFRFCNDFRRLNEASEFDAYPMPRVDELIERLGPARYLSTLDLTKGYWQVPLTRAAREKTAFSTPGGLYQYTVLPFGVHGAPATFQRMMDQLLRPHQDYAAAYIDDIIIYSPSWDIHVRQLRAVLGELRKAGLTANPAKCRLGREETTYLGYRVGRGTVRPQEGKVAAIRAWPQPGTKKQVKAFLGLVGYYQRFIPGYATLASPMNDLTRKALPDRVTWSEAADRAFKTLREALCSEPVLITPDFNLPVIVHTDASEVGLGGVLSQVRAGEEHPITYVSRKLLPNERNYSTVEKEALAIKWCLEKLRYYLLGREFTLVTDHAPLKWMAGAKNTNARVTRWFLALQDFRFRVDHRPGREHANADALSRRDACLGGFPGDQGLEQTGGECGIPPLKPRPERARGTVKDGVYHPHPPAGDGEHRVLPPNQRDGGHLAAGRRKARSHYKRGRDKHGRERQRDAWTAEA